MSSTSIRYVFCESPEQTIWGEYLLLENEGTARKFLKQKYSEQGVEHPDRNAFKNVQSLIYYVKQAKSIFQSIQQNSLWVQPLLLYYGMMGLLKAWILTIDTNYPQSTSVLRHGLSTRKRKKELFRFFQDEIRIQKEGLFPLVANVLNHQPIASGHSYYVEDLYALIPELQQHYQRLFGSATLFPISLYDGKNSPSPGEGMPFTVSEKVLDLIHNTVNGLIDKLNRHGKRVRFELDPVNVVAGQCQIRWFHPEISHVNDSLKGFDHPWFFENSKGDYYLWVGNNRPFEPVAEILAQYMLLFSLSMLCRYETPLWGEMVYSFTSEDMVLIQQLLQVVTRKFPHLMLNALLEEKIVLFIR